MNKLKKLYKEFFGLHWVSTPGAQANIVLNAPSELPNNGSKFYQQVTVPASTSGQFTPQTYTSIYTTDGLVPIHVCGRTDGVLRYGSQPLGRR